LGYQVRNLNALVSAAQPTGFTSLNMQLMQSKFAFFVYRIQSDTLEHSPSIVDGLRLPGRNLPHEHIRSPLSIRSDVSRRGLWLQIRLMSGFQ
jgi:hypothetical protein